MKDADNQKELEEEIKNQAYKFLEDINKTLPQSMELEYEGYYKRGFFVSKKRYAVIEDGEIIAKKHTRKCIKIYFRRRKFW